jgi:hypothetical protein
VPLVAAIVDGRLRELTHRLTDDAAVQPVSLAREWSSLLANAPYLHEYAPQLRRYLQEYPRASLPGAERRYARPVRRRSCVQPPTCRDRAGPNGRACWPWRARRRGVPADRRESARLRGRPIWRHRRRDRPRARREESGVRFQEWGYSRRISEDEVFSARGHAPDG